MALGTQTATLKSSRDIKGDGAPLTINETKSEIDKIAKENDKIFQDAQPQGKQSEAENSDRWSYLDFRANLSEEKVIAFTKSANNFGTEHRAAVDDLIAEISTIRVLARGVMLCMRAELNMPVNEEAYKSLDENAASARVRNIVATLDASDELLTSKMKNEFSQGGNDVVRNPIQSVIQTRNR